MRKKHAVFICAALICIVHVITDGLADNRDSIGVGVVVGTEMLTNPKPIETAVYMPMNVTEPDKLIRRLRSPQAAQQF